MDALDWLVADRARDEVVRLMPEFNVAAEKSLVKTDQGLGDLTGHHRRQVFADLFRAYLAAELEMMLKEPELNVESGNRNGITLHVAADRPVQIRVLKAQRKDGSPRAGQQSIQRQEECAFTAALFNLHEIGCEVQGPVALMLTWRVDIKGVHLHLTLPKDPQGLTRYAETAHWNVPLDFPAIPGSADLAAFLDDDDDDDDLGYGRRMPRTGEADGNDDGDDGDDAA